jgi:hypothetical protein
MTMSYTQRAAAWARAGMESELRDFAATSAHRNDALNKAAFTIGQLVGGGLIEHCAAHDRLVEIAQGIGLMTPDERKKSLSTIEHALADGMMHPRCGPEDSGDGRSGWQESGANGAADQQEGDGAREFAKRRWDAARPAGSDTLVGAYLRSRGIASPPPPSVRFHPVAAMPGGSRHPALLACVTNPISGEFLAVHRIALRADGSGKADVSPARATLGSSRGGAVAQRGGGFLPHPFLLHYLRILTALDAERRRDYILRAINILNARSAGAPPAARTEAMLAIGAVFAGLEKKRLVKKLRAARDRKSQEKGRRIEGRPTLAPLHQRFPEAVAMAKRLYRANPKSGMRRSLREISAELAKAGHVMANQYRNKGKGSDHANREKGEARPFNHTTIKAMIEGPAPAKPDPQRRD